MTETTEHNEAGEGKGRANLLTIDHKAEIIARGIAAGKTAKASLMEAGYSESSARQGLSVLPDKLSQGIQEHLEAFRKERSGRVLERSIRMNAQADRLFERLEAGEPLTKAEIDILRLSMKEGSDLLDRVGAGKISKSLSLKGTITDNRTLEELEKRRAELIGKGA